MTEIVLENNYKELNLKWDLCKFFGLNISKRSINQSILLSPSKKKKKKYSVTKSSYVKFQVITPRIVWITDDTSTYFKEG